MRNLVDPLLLFCVCLCFTCGNADAQTATTAAPTTAAVPSRALDLTWQAPPSCPTQAEVVEDIDELLASPARTSLRGAIRAQGVVSERQGGLVLTLSVHDDSGSPRVRHVGAPTCEELGHAAALIIAIALDPTVLERLPAASESGGSRSPGAGACRKCRCRLTELPEPHAIEPTSQTGVAAPTQTESTDSGRAPSDSARRRPTTTPLVWLVGGGAFGAFGTVPGVSAGMLLFSAIQGKYARFELQASRLSSRVNSDTNSSRGATFELYRAAPRACGLLVHEAWAVGPCVSLELGRLSGTGFGVSRYYTKRVLWLAGTAGATVELRLAESSVVGLFADLSVPIREDDFLVAGESVFSTKVSGSVGIRLAAGWP